MVLLPRGPWTGKLPVNCALATVAASNRGLDLNQRPLLANTAVHKLPVDLAPLLESGALWFGLVRQLGPR
jgi:hypothetical protein